MFVGHLACGFAAKRVVPKAPLGLLVAAPLVLDLLWPAFLLLGVESVRIDPGNTAFTPLDFTSYPWSHSLVMACAWGLLVGTAAGAILKSRAIGLVTGLLVVSHWVLDFVSHRPDMPLLPVGGPRLGLGLWNSVPATFAVEGAMWLAAVVLYGKATRPTTWGTVVAFWGFVIFATGIWVAGPFGPPPPSAKAIAIVGLALSWIPLWAEWFDRRRVPAAVEARA